MSTLRRTLGYLLVSSALAGCGGESSSTSGSGAKPDSSGASTSGGSTPAPAYTSSEGRYQIDFRGETPKLSVKDDPNGGRWNEAAMASGAAMVQYTDYESHAHAVAEVKGFIPTRETDKIKVDKAITVAGLEGRDIEMTLSSGKIFWIRFLIDGKRAYKIGAAFPEAKRADATSFVESFKLSGAPAPAGGSAAPASGSAAPAPSAR